MDTTGQHGMTEACDSSYMEPFRSPSWEFPKIGDPNIVP